MKKLVSVLLSVLMFVSVFAGINISASAASDTSSAAYKVKNLKQIKVTTNSFSLSWKKVSGAKYYQIFFSKDSGITWKTASSKVRRTSATVKSFAAGTKYWLKVRAIVGSKKTKGAASDPLKTQTRCKAPTIKLTAKGEAATASWNKISGAKSYSVYKSKNNKTWSKAGSTTKLSFTLAGLTAGKRIYVKVYTVNAYGKSSSASKAKNVTVKTLESYLPNYADVINQYQVFIKKGFDTEWYENHIEKYSYINSEYVNDQSSANPTYYSLHDINKDGVPELLIKYDSIIHSVYTYKSGKVVKLFDWGRIETPIILKNGIIVVSGYAGSYESYFAFYKYKSTSSKPVLMDYLTEKASYNGSEYYKGENAQTEISFADATSIMEKYTGQSKFYFEKLPSEIAPTWKKITSIPSSKLGTYNGIIRKYMEGNGSPNPTYGYYDSAVYYYLNLKTPYSTKKVLVVETLSGTYNPYTFVYVKNNKGKIIKYFECPGSITKYTSDKGSLLLYSYIGSGMGAYRILKYNSSKKTYKTTNTYTHEMDTRDSVAKKVNSLTKSYKTDNSTCHVIY